MCVDRIYGWLLRIFAYYTQKNQASFNLLGVGNIEKKKGITSGIAHPYFLILIESAFGNKEGGLMAWLALGVPWLNFIATVFKLR